MDKEKFIQCPNNSKFLVDATYQKDKEEYDQQKVEDYPGEQQYGTMVLQEDNFSQLALINLTDLHLFGDGFDYNRAKLAFKFIENTANAYVLLDGDIYDIATLTSKTNAHMSIMNNSDAIEIINNSHINYGLKIIFSANGTVENPKLTNTYTNETMQINQTMLINEKIVVKTYDNQKSIIHINAQGEETNITHKLVFGTNFLKAPNGINRFTSTADTGSSYLEVEIDYYNYYEAV